MTKLRARTFTALVFTIITLCSSTAAWAQHNANEQPIQPVSIQEHHETEEINTTEVILDHIQDNYVWEYWGHSSFGLPVILYTSKGLEVFSGAKLFDEHHKPVAYQGNHTYKVNPDTKKIELIGADGKVDAKATFYDVSITKNVATLLLTTTLILFIFLYMAKRYTKQGITSAPKGIQSVLEPFIIFIRDDVAKPNIGPKYAKFMPLLLSLFFFIWLNNMLGLVPFFPGGANLSGNIAFTLVLAVVVFFVVNLNGNANYWGHIFAMPGVPKWLLVLLTPIEIVGIFIKPVSLMIRLFANITAGHVLVLALICLIFVLKSIAVAAVAVPFAVFIYFIELLVAFLQAFIFTILTSLYIGMAVEEHHHEAKAH